MIGTPDVTEEGKGASGVSEGIVKSIFIFNYFPLDKYSGIETADNCMRIFMKIDDY